MLKEEGFSLKKEDLPSCKDYQEWPNTRESPRAAMKAQSSQK